MRHDIALFAIHTNLDNVLEGVSGEMARSLGLKVTGVLAPRPHELMKLVVFVPMDHLESVRKAVFTAGAGQVGAYDECSFGVSGQGTFRAGDDADPYVGEKGLRHMEPEVRLEVLVPSVRMQCVVQAMKAAHPYEEVAHDLIPLVNVHPAIGSGAIGEWAEPIDERSFLERIKEVFGVHVVRHTRLRGTKVGRVAVCGGSGAFLVGRAIAAGADAFITADVKYHEFQDAEDRVLLADVGHYGSERPAMGLIVRHLAEKFPSFAVRLTETVTDPIHYS
jgi:hypothetical protein